MSKPLAALAAALVLLSGLAGVAGAATLVADGAEPAALTTDGVAEQTEAADHDLQSGGAYWSGQRLAFDASEIVPGDASESERTFELWRVTEDGQLNQRVDTFTVDENAQHLLETDALEGRFAVRYAEQVVYVHDGVGYLDSPPDGSQVTVDSSAFAFTRQTLDFAWSDPTVYPGQDVTLTLTSNREDYVVAVSGDGLSFENLTEAFPETAYAENYDERADEDVLFLRAGPSTTIHLDTTALEPGPRPLAFDVVDAAMTKSAHLTVNEPAEDGRFVSVERNEHVGDVIEANLSCSHCFLVVGGPGQGILDVVELSDANGDGHVELLINTRYAGMQVSASGYPSGVEAYTSPDDKANRYAADALLETVDEELNYNVVTLDDLRDQQGLASQGRLRPVEPGPVKLTVTSSDFLIDRSAYGDRAPYGSQLVIRDERDVRTVTLEPRLLSGVETLAAPGGSRLPTNVDELTADAGPRDSIALGDFLVFRVDVSGIFGYLQANGASVETFQDSRGEGIRLTLAEVAEDGPGTSSLSLEQTALRVYADPDTDSLYVAVQTGGTSRANLQEGRYRARLTLEGVDGQAAGYSTKGAYEGYPYVDPGASESASASARVEAPQASIEGPEAGASPHLNAEGALEVSGVTSIAPGGSLQLVATSTEYAWETSATASVDETGRWTGSIDLAEAPGEEFTVTVVRGDTPLAERTYAVRPPLENGSSESGGGGSGGSDGGSGVVPGGGGGGALSGLMDLALPVGGALGLVVTAWAAWTLLVRRMLLKG